MDELIRDGGINNKYIKGSIGMASIVNKMKKNILKRVMSML